MTSSLIILLDCRSALVEHISFLQSWTTKVLNAVLVPCVHTPVSNVIYSILPILPTQSGVTPLHIAQQHGHSDVVTTLITYGANVIDLPFMVLALPLYTVTLKFYIATDRVHMKLDICPKSGLKDILTLFGEVKES